MYGYIYETVNLINGKKYIGQHSKSEFDPDYYGSGVILNNAINKYGIDNFRVKILKECDSSRELDEWENYYIEKFNAVESEEYYNMIPGGGATYASLIAKTVCSKPIMCVETGNIYPSLSFLEEHFGFYHGNLSKAVNLNVVMYGYHWKYVDKTVYKEHVKLRSEEDMKYDFERYVFDNSGERNPMYHKEVSESTISKIRNKVSNAWKSGNYNSIKVPVRGISIRDGTSIEFNSGIEAARYLEKNCGIRAAYTGNIYKASREGRVAYGHRWECVSC